MPSKFLGLVRCAVMRSGDSEGAAVPSGILVRVSLCLGGTIQKDSLGNSGHLAGLLMLVSYFSAQYIGIRGRHN